MVPPRGYIFIGLNVVRALSIVGLLLVFSSSIEVMVTNIKAVNAFQANKNSTDSMLDCDYIEGSTVPNQAAGVFWAIVSTLLVIFQTIILLLSECSWPLSFFDRFFPVLGSNFGLGALGIFQCLIGAQILSHHVDKFTLVSAFFLFSIGCLNMLLGLIFRESAKEKRSIKIWRNNSKNILPSTTNDTRPVFVNSPAFVSNMFTGGSSSTMNEKAQSRSEFGTWSSTDKAGFGFGRQGEKAAGLKGFILRVPEETLPRYASPTPPPAAPTAPASLSRNKSTRTSTSSFASPGPIRHSVQSASHYEGEEEEEEEEEEEHSSHHANAQGQGHMFKSSPTAL